MNYYKLMCECILSGQKKTGLAMLPGSDFELVFIQALPV